MKLLDIADQILICTAVTKALNTGRSPLTVAQEAVTDIGLEWKKEHADFALSLINVPTIQGDLHGNKIS